MALDTVHILHSFPVRCLFPFSHHTHPPQTFRAVPLPVFAPYTSSANFPCGASSRFSTVHILHGFSVRCLFAFSHRTLLPQLFCTVPLTKHHHDRPYSIKNKSLKIIESFWRMPNEKTRTKSRKAPLCITHQRTYCISKLMHTNCKHIENIYHHKNLAQLSIKNKYYMHRYLFTHISYHKLISISMQDSS